MKNSRIYSALLFMVLAAGCQREEIAAPESGKDVMEVYATIEEIADAQTKTYLAETEVLWIPMMRMATLSILILMPLFRLL